MELYVYPLGNLDTNCYVLVNEQTRDAVAIDIGGEAGYLMLKEIEKNFKIKHVLLTHGHFDHIRGTAKFFKRGAKVYIGEKDKEFILDNSLNLAGHFRVDVEPFEAIGVKEGDKLSLCGFEILVKETPGHTHGSVSYVLEDKIFCGDLLFDGSYGRVDFPTGDIDVIANSIKRIFNEGDKIVYPGHGQATTIEIEKNSNPILEYYD